MRTKLILLLLIICSEFSFSQILVDPKIDERVELASIICMYASNEVESSVESTSYFRKTYEYFKDYGAENIFMELYSLKTQFLIDPNLLIPDALTWKLQNGEITYSMESSEQKSELQKRLNKDDYINLINQINLFYKNTNFHTFFISNTKIYEEAIAVFNTDVISRFETSIFENIAGKSTESIDLYINLLVGSKTYAIPQNKSIILGGFIERFYPYNNTHVLGMSGFGSELVYPLICNLYTIMYNNNIESYRSEVDYFTLLYYNSFQSQFDKSELNPTTILQNQVSKLFALLYYTKVDNQMVSMFIQRDKTEGFIWQNELWDSLAEFNKNRSIYNNYQDFMPILMSHYKSLIFKLSRS